MQRIGTEIIYEIENDSATSSIRCSKSMCEAGMACSYARCGTSVANDDNENVRQRKHTAKAQKRRTQTKNDGVFVYLTEKMKQEQQ